MPRNISFFFTKRQFLNRTKTVTRRLGWLFLKPGDILNACEKCQGLKKGESINKFGRIQVVDVRIEPLNAITNRDCISEGFPNLTPAEFVSFFCKHMKCAPDIKVTRIEFKYLEGQAELKQTHMFPWGDDLPLFSGTAPRVDNPPFVPTVKPQAQQSPLFPLEGLPTTGKKFKCPYCGYECDWSELGGEYDCPRCGDN
jgi:hypothetical protein